MSEWISVESKIPYAGDRVLLLSEDGMYVGWRTIDGYSRDGDLDNFAVFSVTHWMPLPEPPND